MSHTLRRLPLWSLALTVACSGPEQVDPPPGSDLARKRAAQAEAEAGRERTRGVLDGEVGPAPKLDKPSVGQPRAPAGAKPVERDPSGQQDGATQGSAGIIEKRVLDGELHEVVAGTGEAKTADDARNRALAAARASLVAYQRQHIKQDLSVAISEKISGTDSKVTSRYREEMESLLVARSDGELQRCRVLDAPEPRRTEQGYRATAVVAVPERVLFPQRRLQALVEDAKTPVATFVQLAAAYEGEAQLALAEQALRWGYDRGGGADAALAMAMHYDRRSLTAEALRWFDAAAREAGADSPVAATAKARAAEVRGRVEPADKLVEQLVQVAESKQDRSRFGAYVLERRVSGAEVAWDVRWSIRGNTEARVLKMWLDDSLTPAWWAQDEDDQPQASSRDGGVQFAMPRDAKPARVLFWLLPLDSDLWPRLVEWKNCEVKLGAGEADEPLRLRLRDLLVGLRNSRAAAAIVPVAQ